jgi:hypothetical protein
MECDLEGRARDVVEVRSAKVLAAVPYIAKVSR